MIRANGGASEKLIDGFFRGDWISQPTGAGTWIVSSDGTNRIRLIDVERKAVIWDVQIPGSGGALPVFSPDGRAISVLYQAGTNHDALQVLNSSDGSARVAGDLPFRTTFRASWIDGGHALIVNWSESESHIALFDHFWEPARR
jgi:hypothetical protein